MVQVVGNVYLKRSVKTTKEVAQIVAPKEATILRHFLQINAD